MKIPAKSLQQHLKRQLQSLYIVSGDDPYLVQEAYLSIKNQAQKNGFTGYQRYDDKTDFEISVLTNEAYSMGLFEDKKVITIQFSKIPADPIKKALQAYSEKPSVDTLLILTLPRLDQKQQKSKWFSQLEQRAGYIQVWPIDQQYYPGWLQKKASEQRIKLTPQAAQQLAEATSSNLLAGAQAIEKLSHLGATQVDESILDSVLIDQAKFDIFTLSEACLSGNADQSLQIISNLQAEGTEPILVLWALTNDIRQLCECFKLQEKQNLSASLKALRIWDKKQPMFKSALNRHTLDSTYILLKHCYDIDKVIKGVKPGDVWLQLEKLCIGVLS